MPSFVVSGGGNNNVQLNTGMIVFGGRGGRGNEGIAQTDGIGTGAAINGGGVSGYGRLDTTQEVVMTSTGGLGDVEVGGPIVNLVPRTGGNTFENRFQASGLTGAMQGSNFSEELRQAGLRTPAETRYQWDSSLTNGGPFVRDRLWFFFALRYQGNASTIPGMFNNKNAGDNTKWTYDPDFDRPAQQRRRHVHADDAPDVAGIARSTVRRVLGCRRFQDRRENYPGMGNATNAPETGGIQSGERQLTPAASQVDVDHDEPAAARGGSRHVSTELERARAARQRSRPDSRRRTVHQWMSRQREHPGPDVSRHELECRLDVAESLVRIRDLCHRRTQREGRLSGCAPHQQSNPFTNNHNLQYRFNNGVPNQLTQNLLPYRTDERTRYDALFVQDQWTRGRLTLQGALRYDHAWSYYPAQQIGPTRFLPQGLFVPDTKGVLGYHDINPRVGVAYDVFGNGKTALKFNTGRYLEAAVNGNGNYSELRPINRVSNSVTRTWTDANRNFTAGLRSA